jgi:hypothetical protein
LHAASDHHHTHTYAHAHARTHTHICSLTFTCLLVATASRTQSTARTMPWGGGHRCLPSARAWPRSGFSDSCLASAPAGTLIICSGMHAKRRICLRGGVGGLCVRDMASAHAHTYHHHSLADVFQGMRCLLFFYSERAPPWATCSCRGCRVDSLPPLPRCHTGARLQGIMSS